MRTALISIIVSGLVLTGCAKDVPVKDAGLDAQVIALTSTDDVVVADIWALGCIERGAGVNCYVCEIKQQDMADKGIETNARHIRYEFTGGADAGYVHKKTVEQLSQKFMSEERSRGNAEAMIIDAKKWCKKRGRGVEHMLKNEMEQVFGDGS